MSTLKGKVAVVTGASKGIGAEIARELAKAGAKVVVNYSKDQQGADQVVAGIRQQGGAAIAVQADVSKLEQVDGLFQQAKDAYGKLDVLVNNAGIYKFGPLNDVEPEEFHRQFDTNVLGLLLASREAVRRFGEEGGSIINVGSAVTTLHPPNSSIYTATKGAVDAITQVLARELGPKKIRVNSINPGMIETEGAHAAGFIGSPFQKQVELDTPLGRIGQPTDVAKIALFLASEAAGWLTGELISASGGNR